MLKTDSKTTLVNELDLITIIIRRLVDGGSYPIDWEWFKDTVAYHEIFPLTYLYFKDLELSIPEDLILILKNNYYYNLRHCQELQREFLRILKEFESSHISIIPIKGLQFFYDIYGNLPVRPMVDMDFLVKEEDVQKSKAVLSDLGYKKTLRGLKEEYWRQNQYHLAFARKDGRKTLMAELHWGLDYKRKGRMVLTGLWGRTRGVELEGRKIRLLSTEDTLFSIALHNRRFGKPLNIKYAVDLVLLLNKYAYRFDWDYVLSQCRKYNLFALVFFSLSQAEFLQGLNLPRYVWNELKVPDWKKRLIQRFIRKNTFPLQTQAFSRTKSLYLKSHFFLYDSLWEPVSYILNIPQEQFAKYYQLKPYEKRTSFLYNIRLFYMLFKAIVS